MFLFGCEEDEPFSEPNYDDDIILHEMWPFPVGVAVPGGRTSNVSGGAATNNALLDSNPQHQFLRHFNVVVSENEMKPDSILPSSRPAKDPSEWEAGDFNWTHADALVDYAYANNKGVRFHTLIWHAQTPSWFFPGTSVGTGTDRMNALYAHMEHYIRVVMERYKDRVKYWDVVNEAVDHDTSGARMDSEYTKIMIAAGKTGINRYEYIVKAFEWAREYGNNDIELYLTDFGIERPFTRGGTTKQGDFKLLVEYLIQNDAPIDGVGFQGHFRLYDHPVDQISAGIDLFAALQRNSVPLKVQICELDISVFSNAKGENNDTEIANENLEQRLKDLAQTYRDYFNMFEQKYNAGKLNAVVIWGIADGHSWLNDHPLRNRTDYPLLFNRNYKAKDAYVALTTNRPGFPQ